MKKYGFGADVGGTTIKMGLFTTEGELLEKWEIATDTSDGGTQILAQIADTVEQHREARGILHEEIEGIGIGVPGAVDSRGVVNKAVNLGWGVVPAAEQLQQLSGYRVEVGNDANVAALGENWKGSGRGYDSICMVTLGTGIGGGIVVDGQIVLGANGAGGEIGHMNVNSDETESCNCGRKGCLEQYASATGIVRVAKKMIAAYDGETGLTAFGESLAAKDIFDLAKAGDHLAIEIVDYVCGVLGKAFGAIACVVNPAAFVIGGGVSKAGEILIDKIRPAFQASTFHACVDTDIVLASLGNDAGIYGAFRMLL